MLWTEKYRPKSVNEIRGQEHYRMDATIWVEEEDMPNVLYYGNPGNGKTAAAIATARDMLKDSFEDNFIELNASDDRRLETVRTTIKNVAQSGVVGDAPFRIMLLDEMDGMKIIFALQSRCANYHFAPLDAEVILEVVQNILASEEIDRFNEDEIRSFIASGSLDLRRAITEIQAAKAGNLTLKKQITISLEAYTEGLNLIQNNKSAALDYLHKMLVDGRNVKEICRGLHDAVLDTEMDSKIKFKYLRAIGETEWRSSTMTPKVLISWMVGQL